MCDLETIQTMLEDDASGLREQIVREIGNFTVALLAVDHTNQGERLKLAGTGTLVMVENSHYILTAAHVWECMLNRAEAIGITLREDVDHRFLLATNTIIVSALRIPDMFGEWGPDLMFLRIPVEHVGSIEAYRSFYNLSRERRTKPATDCLEFWLLMGTPEILGTFTQAHANLQICGFLMGTDIPQVRGEFDFLDFNANLSLPGVPQGFGGVSGGGLWRVRIFRSPSTGEIQTLRVLEGVAFFELASTNNHRIIRCHGPKSLSAAAQALMAAP